MTGHGLQCAAHIASEEPVSPFWLSLVMFIIFAANWSPVVILTHFLTTLKAPLGGRRGREGRSHHTTWHQQAATTFARIGSTSRTGAGGESQAGLLSKLFSQFVHIGKSSNGRSHDGPRVGESAPDTLTEQGSGRLYTPLVSLVYFKIS